jgi:Delta7-sterol 5-desaturase
MIFPLIPVTASFGLAAMTARKTPLLHNWHTILLTNYAAQFVEYGLTAGLAFVLFYILLRRALAGRKIQPTFPSNHEMRREIFYSLQSMAVFAAIGLLATILDRLGWTRLYFRIDHYGWLYFFFSIAALIFLHDTWFYWTHRLMHWRPLFRLAHRVHHQSHNPSPWAAFAFHPIEAVIEGMIYPVVILFLPLHPLAALAWLIYMITMNVGGHLGFEILPPGFAQHWLFRWHNTSVHHNMHHSHIHCNYGLYFNLWDRLMHTNHARYEEHFDRVVDSNRDLRDRGNVHAKLL